MSDLSPNSFATFGELLKYLRRRAGLKQRELGLAVGYSAAQITRLEGGQRPPDVLAVKTQFVMALGLAHEPELAARLIKLAETAHRQHAPAAPTSATGTMPESGPSNLPTPLTRFVGREQEMAAVRQLLGAHRLVTLMGAGGVGKTRLAVEVGTTFVAIGCAHLPASPANGGQQYSQSLPLLIPAFPGGVWLAEFAPTADTALVPQVVATALDLPEQPSRSPLEVLTAFLRDKRLLLILDNCEHLIQACAELAVALLSACPHLRILATSREALRVPGEVALRVPSLSTPGLAQFVPLDRALDYEAIEFFVDLASAVQPEFTLTPDRLAVVIQVCRRLDGIPLAIELATACLSAVGLADLAARLDDRFALLTGGARTAMPRHQTLRAMLDWSYDLLPNEEGTLLHELAVFAGGWSLEAAEAMHGSLDTTDLLTRLVRKSLVGVEEHGTVTRYRMLETIRQYALEKLIASGGYERARQRHLEYFTGLAQLVKKVVGWLELKAWRDRMVTEIDNLRMALDWATQSRDVRHGEELLEGLYPLCYYQGYVTEGVKWIESILPASDRLSDSTRVKRGFWLGNLALRMSNFRRAQDQLAEASALAHRLEDDGLILRADGTRSHVITDHAEALHITRECILRAQRIGQKGAEASAMTLLGRRLRIIGNYDESTQWLVQSIAFWRELEDQRGLNYAAAQLGLVALAHGDVIRARALFEECVTLARQTDLTVDLAEYLTGLGMAAVQQGDYLRALAAVRESITIFHWEGDLYRIAQGMSVVARVAQDTGQLERAAHLLGAVAALRRDFPPEFLWVEPTLHEEYERCLPITRAAMGEVAFAAAWAEGQQMSPDQAVAYALQGSQAEAEAAQREPPVR